MTHGEAGRRLLPASGASSWGAPADDSLLAAFGRLSMARRLGAALFAALAVYVLWSFPQHNISNDEPIQQAYGELLLRFYASGFQDRAAFELRNLYLYGGLFDMIAAGLADWVPLHLYAWRHLLSGLFGLAGMVAVWKAARLLAGERVALLAVLLLTLTGAWIGALFTHTKDIPFAAAMAWATYYTLRVVPCLPAPPRGVVVKLGVAVGCAFGLRVGAALAVVELLLVVGLAALLLGGPGWAARGRFLARAIWNLLPGGLIALALMAVFWPWAVMAPGNLLEAVGAFSHFTFDLETLFAGQTMLVGDVPRLYLPAYLAVRLPELTLIGLALLPMVAMRPLARLRPGARGDRRRVLRWLPLLLAAGLPLAVALLTRPSLYNGIRHFTFLLPPLSVLAAVGLLRAWEHIRPRRRLAAAALGLAGALGGFGLVTLVMLHPYQYVAYNLLTGGLPGAAGRWERDYWSESLMEASHRLAALVDAEDRVSRRPFLVAVCAEGAQVEDPLGARFSPTTEWGEADFFISAAGIGCDDVMDGERVITVSRLGVPLAFVLDRRGLTSRERKPLE